MNTLHDRLKSMAEQYPGSMAELARQSHVDRSTLYKILSGRRTPTETQLQNLLDVFGAGRSVSAEIKQMFAESQHSGEQRYRYRMVEKLLYRIFDIQRVMAEAQSLPVQPAQRTGSGAYLQGTETIRRWLLDEVQRYRNSGEQQPLMLSPALNRAVVQGLVMAFCRTDAVSQPVWQLCSFVQEEPPTAGFDRNIETLAEVMPFLFLPAMRYEARLCYTPGGAILPGLPMPVYLLFPDLCIFMDDAGHHAVSIADPQAVAFIRLQYSRQYLRASNAMFLSAKRLSAEECIAHSRQLGAAGEPAFFLQEQPPLGGCLSPAFTAAAQRTASGPKKALLPHAYFTESGVLRFLQTGRIDDLPRDRYEPLSPEARRTVLRTLRDHCEKGERTLRLLNDNSLPVGPGIGVRVYPGQGVLLRQCDEEQTVCRQCLLQERTVTDALYDYLTEIRTSQRVCSQKYTVEFLDYCLRTAP